MNERIKTLALTIPNVYSIEYENGTKGIEFTTEEAFDRFAELIVRVCAELCLAHETMNYRDSMEYRKGHHFNTIIKNHFGVEL